MDGLGEGEREKWFYFVHLVYGVICYAMYYAVRSYRHYSTPSPSTINTALPLPGLLTTTAASLCSALNSLLA